jgi:DNA primase
MLSYEYIQFLNEKLLQYIPQPYVRVGDKVNFRCPLCGDSKKSSTKKRGWLYTQSCSYYCFNCGTSLSGIKLLQYLSGNDYESIKREYVKLFLKSGQSTSLSSYVETPHDEPNIFNPQRILNPDLKKPLSQKAIEYLSKRKILSAPFLKEKLFSTYSDNNPNEEFILIPWKLNGIDAYYQVNDFLKIRSLKYMFPKNKKKLLYGLDNIDPQYKKIFVFEGVYDSLFVKNGIASGTKSITDYQLKIIKNRWPNHEICVSFDNDAAGFGSIKKLIEKNTNFSFFKWFNETTKEKDINDYILAINNINAFVDQNVLDTMIIDKLQMKLWMMRTGNWKDEQRNNIIKNACKKQAFLLPYF